MTTYIFWCHRLNDNSEPDGRPFGVSADSTEYIGNLQQMIKDSAKPRFDNVVVDELELWKVVKTISTKTSKATLKSEIAKLNIPDRDSMEESTDDVEQLNPVEELSHYWNTAPKGGYLHVIVRAPPGKLSPSTSSESKMSGIKRPLKPPDHALGIDAIDQKIKLELEPLCKFIRAFLENPYLPEWVPPEHISDSSTREFLKSLRIPTYSNGKPSLLFHNLSHIRDHEQIEQIFGREEHVFICNVSGSGKTRRMIEGLTKYWGFYLVAIPDANGVGVSDLNLAMKEVEEYEDWEFDLQSSQRRARGNSTNRHIVSKLLRKVLAARIVVFGVFLQLVMEIDKALTDRHKHIWLLFQLSDNLCETGEHPFVRIMNNCLSQASNDALVQLIGRLPEICRKYFHTSSSPRMSTFIIGLDEAQHAARLYPYSFLSSKNDAKYCSMLSPIITTITELRGFKLVVSGTGLSLEETSDVMASGVSKPLGFQLFHQLGMFDTWPKLEPLLHRYIPASVLNSPSGERLQQRIREYLLGRYRFSISFVEHLVRNGLESPHTLLNEYLRQHMDCLPGDTGLPFTLEEPRLRINVSLIGFDWDRLQDDPVALGEVAKIVQSHLTNERSPTFGPVTASLVEYGIARLREEHKGEITEPLAFLSLMKWLEKRPSDCIRTNLRSRLSNQASRGSAYEELSIFYLLRAFGKPSPLSSVFRFHGTTPLWADEVTQIVARRDGTSVPVNILGVPQNPSLSVVSYAASIEDVLEWLDTPCIGSRPAVLIPSPLFGPDVLVLCGSILLMGQLKSYLDGNVNSLHPAILADAITSLHPEHWFKKASLVKRRELVKAIEKRRVLRFVGGYPLPPNFDSNAQSVRDAITALGPDVTLASFNLDEHRANFITENEAQNLLAPMEHALSRKRNAD